MIELNRRIEILKTETYKNKKERDFLNHCKYILENMDEIYSRNKKEEMALFIFAINSGRINRKEIPRNLFKYSGLDNSLKSIEGKYIWFSSVEGFNDPFEGIVPLDFNKTSNEEILKFLMFHRNRNNGIDITKGKYRDISKNRKYCFDMIFNSVQKNVKETGVFCCSEKADIITMWSHYAQSHKGVCFEYDILEDPSAFKYVSRVKYQSVFPSEIYINDSFPEKSVKKQELLNKSLFTKSDIWKNEKEVRVIQQFKTGKTPIRTQCLKSVIFGLECPPEKRAVLIELLKNKDYNNDIVLKQAFKKDGFYELEMRPLGLLQDF